MKISGRDVPPWFWIPLVPGLMALGVALDKVAGWRIEYHDARLEGKIDHTIELQVQTAGWSRCRSEMLAKLTHLGEVERRQVADSTCDKLFPQVSHQPDDHEAATGPPTKGGR